MKVTIITVCFNSEKTLTDTIESVLTQFGVDLEYLIIDGGSHDSTTNIIGNFAEKDSRIRWLSEPDNGIYDAMNKGLRLANGDIIGFLNSDDVYYSKYVLSNIAKQFEQDEALESVYGDIQYVSSKDLSIVVRQWKSGNIKSFSTGWHPAHPSFYVRERVYRKYGYFSLDFQLAADFELMVRFLGKYGISTIYLKTPMVKMRLGGATNRSWRNILKQNLECLQALKLNGIRIIGAFYVWKRFSMKIRQF